MEFKQHNNMKMMPLSRLFSSKSMLIITLIWLLIYFVQISNFALSNVKESVIFEITGMAHSISFITLFFVFFSRIQKATPVFVLAQLLVALLLIFSYSHGYLLVSNTYFVPNASDALLYNTFALAVLKDGFVVTVYSFFEQHGVADLGASIYVYLVYLISPNSPISIYCANLFLVLGIVFILKLKNENKLYTALRFTLLINPFVFFLTITSFKELPMICFFLLGLKCFFNKSWFMCTLYFVLLFLFRPAISALFVVSILVNIGGNNLYLIFTKLRVNKKVILIIPITLGFIVAFPYLLKFLESGLFATLSYYKENSSLSSYSIPVAFMASYFTGFLGPLYKPFTTSDFSLGMLYSFFYPIGVVLNFFCFYNILSNRKFMDDQQKTVFIFILLGLISISAMLRGFDLRFTLIFYIALWWLNSSILTNLTTKNIQKRVNK